MRYLIISDSIAIIDTSGKSAYLHSPHQGDGQPEGFGDQDKGGQLHVCASFFNQGNVFPFLSDPLCQLLLGNTGAFPGVFQDSCYSAWTETAPSESEKDQVPGTSS